MKAHHSGEIVPVNLQVPGLHNVANALAALGAAQACGVRLAEAAAYLDEFSGIRRRLEVVGTGNGITVIDDFAHNPDKIAATLETLHAFPGRLLLMFQPQERVRSRRESLPLLPACGARSRHVAMVLVGPLAVRRRFVLMSAVLPDLDQIRSNEIGTNGGERGGSLLSMTPPPYKHFQDFDPATVIRHRAPRLCSDTRRA